MKIYNSEQIKKSLEDAGFTDIKIHKNKKGWLCVVCKKDPSEPADRNPV